jgi:hypothetical protein
MERLVTLFPFVAVVEETKEMGRGVTVGTGVGVAVGVPVGVAIGAGPTMPKPKGSQTTTMVPLVVGLPHDVMFTVALARTTKLSLLPTWSRREMIGAVT